MTDTGGIGGGRRLGCRNGRRQVGQCAATSRSKKAATAGRPLPSAVRASSTGRTAPLQVAAQCGRLRFLRASPPTGILRLTDNDRALDRKTANLWRAGGRFGNCRWQQR
ncbi:hypothetical protein Ppa06_66800 [Planomonospora parontospora subsp. parontospora]|uniref:Uncharacterized protein n=2 Tax=Planomonospora parontospora TaxID=58119 RepID=A0AA37BNX2_9ACTN|nr:hypothetical protein GCM10010126_67480 [Planomonospora parontospora]GII12882.1 hypothetical protein Ppa06_66800 [Planomonospora parontospora subsp. parontospora]